MLDDKLYIIVASSTDVRVHNVQLPNEYITSISLNQSAMLADIATGTNCLYVLDVRNRIWKVELMWKEQETDPDCTIQLIHSLETNDMEELSQKRTKLLFDSSHERLLVTTASGVIFVCGLHKEIN